MKTFKLSLLALSLSLVAAAPLASFADTLTLTGVNGQITGGEYIYPYYFTITTPTTTTTNVALSCLNLDRVIDFGETWSVVGVDVLDIPSGGLDGESQQQFLEDAWLFNLYTPAAGNAQQTADIQYAIWDVMDPSGAAANPGFNANAQSLVAQAFIASQGNTSYAANDLVFIPVAGSWPEGNGEPQIFMMDPPPAETPEPSGLVLFGTGLVGMAGIVMRRSKMLAQTLTR